MTDTMEQKMLDALLGRHKTIPAAMALSREEMVEFIQKYTNVIAVASRVELLKILVNRTAGLRPSECVEGCIINLDKLPVDSVLAAYNFIKWSRSHM